MEILVDSFSFSFKILNILFHSLQAWKVSVAKSANINVGTHSTLFITSLLTFIVLKFLLFAFWPFNYNISQSSPIWAHLILNLLDLIDMNVHFSPKIWGVFSHCCFNYGLCPFFFILSFSNSHKENIFSFCPIILINFSVFLFHFSFLFL